MYLDIKLWIQLALVIVLLICLNLVNQLFAKELTTSFIKSSIPEVGVFSKSISAKRFEKKAMAYLSVYKTPEKEEYARIEVVDNTGKGYLFYGYFTCENKKNNTSNYRFWELKVSVGDGSKVRAIADFKVNCKGKWSNTWKEEAPKPKKKIDVKKDKLPDD